MIVPKKDPQYFDAGMVIGQVGQVLYLACQNV